MGSLSFWPFSHVSAMESSYFYSWLHPFAVSMYTSSGEPTEWVLSKISSTKGSVTYRTRCLRKTCVAQWKNGCRKRMENVVFTKSYMHATIQSSLQLPLKVRVLDPRIAQSSNLLNLYTTRYWRYSRQSSIFRRDTGRVLFLEHPVSLKPTCGRIWRAAVWCSSTVFCLCPLYAGNGSQSRENDGQTCSEKATASKWWR